MMSIETDLGSSNINVDVQRYPTRLGRRLIKVQGENYNEQYLQTLKEFNPKAYRNLGRLVAIALRKKRREKIQEYYAELLNYLINKGL